MEAEGQIIRVGSRKSELALIQTNYVIECLQKVHPEIEFKIVTMTTLGDRILNVSLPKIGEKSLFTKDLEEALHSGTVDFVVHSLKDLPTTLPEGLAIGAVFEREDPRDALVLRDDLKGKTLATLPPRSCIGTSSLRRTAQLRALHPHLRIVDVRGNLNTRLRKLQHHSTTGGEGVKGDGGSGNGVKGDGGSDRGVKGDGGSDNSVKGDGGSDKGVKGDGGSDSGVKGDGGSSVKTEEGGAAQEYAALILAQAGLVRMGWQDRVSQVLPCSEMMYAVGQGALAVECRAGDARVRGMLAAFDHPETYCRILVERSFLKALGGGCSAPVGVSTSLKPFDNQHRLTISGAVWSLDGVTKVHDKIEQVFPQVRRTDAPKHNLSPTEEGGSKKLKVEHDDRLSVNPIEEYNRRISEGKNLNCEDTRSEEEIRLAEQSGERDSNSNLEHSIDDQILNKESDVVSKSVRLYCGLAENTNVLTDVIEKCERMGEALANNLISKGALDVMKVSQDYIRSSVKKL